MELGDRLFVSFMTVPGFAQVYTDRELNPLITPGFVGLLNRPAFSLQMVDAQLDLYTWYGIEKTFFSRDTKLVIGHTSANYYVIVDGTGGELPPQRERPGAARLLRVQRAAAAVHLHELDGWDEHRGTGLVPVRPAGFQYPRA